MTDAELIAAEIKAGIKRNKWKLDQADWHDTRDQAAAVLEEISNEIAAAIVNKLELGDLK